MNFIAPSPANIGNSPTDSVFTSYLINDLIASGLYERSLSSKNPEEQEIFKKNLTEIWFKALSGATHMTGGGLDFAITNLSSKCNWTDSQIKQLCSVLNYDANKEMKNNPHSWRVVYRQ